MVTALAAVAALAAAVPFVANAVLGTDGPTLFELDGNIVDDSGAPNLPQDWSDFQQTPGNGPGPVAKVFVTDGINGVNDTTYTGGGSQNNNDIPSWAWDCGSVPSKSDIEHAFAAAYIKNDNLYVYFGADRYDPTGGTTNVGFWFLQGGGALTGGTGCPDTNPAANKFSGAHVNGDIYVFAEFTGGGGDSAISIYEWKNGALSLLFAKSAGSFCNLADTICGKTNTGLIDVTWPYTDNQGTAAGKIATGGFFEGGINLTALYQGLGKELPCVNQFLASTGSSFPDTGVLKDFAGGSFNLCSRLIVDKVTVPSGSPTKFPFSITGPNAYSQAPQLADGDTPFDSGLVKAGEYTVVETNPNATLWQLTSVVCVDGGGNNVPYSNNKVNIGPGQTVTCTFTNTFQKQNSSTATTSSPTGGGVVPGTSVSDSATVSPVVNGQQTPTGTVDFFLCQPAQVTANGGDCSTGGTKVGGTKALVAGSVTSDASTNTTAIGKYCWRAEYSGDAFYNGSSHTNSTSECFTTVKQNSSTATTSSPTGGGVVPGTSVSDSATVSPVVNGQQTPTGTVDFFLCQPAQVTANGGDCSTGGTKVGGTKALVAGSVTSDASTNTTAIGKYCWRAEYSGDAFYNGSSHTNSTSECFTTVKQNSSTATTSSPTGGGVVPGTSVSDSATVSPVVNGQQTPTGTVDFFLCQPAQVTANGGDCSTGGTKVGGTKALVAGSVTSDASTNTTAIGKYCWRAEYSGDAFYNGSSHTNSTSECFTTVKQNSSTATTSSPTGGGVVPGTSVSDSATVSPVVNGQQTPTGTVDFFLCQPAQVTANGGDCSTGGTKVGGTKALVAGSVTSDASTNTTAIGKYCWRAEYSGDAFYNGSSHTNSTSECFTTEKKQSTTVTRIHAGSGSDAVDAVEIFSAPLGSTVHDLAQVTGAFGTPTGNVSFTVYENVSCAGEGAAAGVVALDANGIGHPSSSATVGLNGLSFKATYAGDGIYAGSTGPCEPLQVEKGKITIVKEFVGAPEGATITLRLQGSTFDDSTKTVVDGGSLVNTIAPQEVTVDEIEEAGDVDLALYDESIECLYADDKPVDGGSSSDASSATFDVKDGDDITCTITNSRIPEITVVKQLDPETDPGTVNFTINGTEFTNGGDGFGDGDGTGAILAKLNDNAVSESDNTADLDDYDSEYECLDAEQVDVASGTGTSLANLDLEYGDKVTCTFTNHRKPELTVVKLLDPTDDPGKVDFTVNDVAFTNGDAGYGHEDGTDAIHARLAGNTVSESAHEGTNLADYDATWECSNQTSGTGTSIPAFDLSYGDKVTCTFTNHRLPQVNVVKDLKPDSDPGKFDLFINDVKKATGVGDGGETGFQNVPAGDLEVSEDGHAPTKLSSYYNDLGCDWADSDQTYSPEGTDRMNYQGQFQVGYGDKVVCTFTNERKESSIDVTKTPDPAFVSEPGGTVTYSVEVTNTSKVDDITLDADGFVDFFSKAGEITGDNPGAEYVITDQIDCNRDAEVNEDEENGPIVTASGLPLTLKVGDSVTCTFTKDVNGNGGETEYDLVTVTGTNETGDEVKDDGPAEVDIKDVLPEIDVQKTVKSTGSFGENASLPEPGGNFTYKVEISNTSEASTDPVEITEISDDVYGDLSDDGNSKLVSTTCDDLIGDVIQPGGPAVTCEFVASFTGDPGAKETDTVTATGKDDEGNEASDTDTANVEITDVPSSIEVTKTASPTSVPEPGGPVDFTITVRNTSATDSVRIDVASFTDAVNDGSDIAIADIDCNGDDEGNGLPVDLAVGSDAITCTFTMDVEGNAGDTVTDVVTVTGTDDDGGKPKDDDDAVVTVTDIPTKLAVVKTANPTSVQEGTRAIGFTITITNVLTFTVGETEYTAVDDITVDSLQDDKLGDLDAAGDVTCKVGGVTQSWPITIAPGQSIVCTVTRNVTGNPSTPHVNIATATGVDEDGNPKEASDDATVTFTATPPPPYVPSSDVTVTKSATASVVLPLGGGSAPIVYTIAARNNGPDAAQNVLVSDSAPVDVTFVSATTGKGTCTTTAKAVDCVISNLAAGESVPITINATVNATGTKTNVVVISNKTPIDTNPNNNQAQAQTLVTAPATPPKPPKPPVVAPEICRTLIATPKVLRATGKAQKISITVKQGQKGVAGVTVKITGSGISKTVKTGKNGKLKVTVKPSQPGIVRVAIVGAKACNNQRIGVVGVYEPPVTG